MGKGIDEGRVVKRGAVATDVRTRVGSHSCFAQRGMTYPKTMEWLPLEVPMTSMILPCH